MPAWDTIIFAASIAVGSLLVIGSTLGAADLDTATASIAHDPVPASNGAELEALGLGRIPLVIVVTLFCFLFGGAGLIAEPLWHAWLGPQFGGLACVGAACLVAGPVTSRSCRFLARVLPRTETYAGSKHELVGRTARVVVSRPGGEAVLRVTDAGGAELRVVAFAPEAQLPSGQAVYLVAYDPQRDRFAVEPARPG